MPGVPKEPWKITVYQSSAVKLSEKKSLSIKAKFKSSEEYYPGNSNISTNCYKRRD